MHSTKSKRRRRQLGAGRKTLVHRTAGESPRHILLRNQMICDGPEELFAPQFKRRRIADKRKNISFCLYIVYVLESPVKNLFDFRQGQVFACAFKTGIYQSCIQVFQIHRSTVGKIKHIIVQVSAFDPVFPCAADNSMEFPCKE